MIFIMGNQRTNQSGNLVGGDQAGGNISKTYNVHAVQRTTMSALIEKFKAEMGRNEEFRQKIEKLEHYCKQIDNDEIIGLEPKLEAGGQAALLDFAQRTKELFAKKLIRYQFSETGQQIHAYVLAEIYSRFHRHILPKIQKGLPAEAISDCVQKEVIDPVQGVLEENVLGLYADEINGMLYFLTGNCHIKWVK